MDLASLISKAGNLREDIKNKNTELREVEQLIADTACPFSVGSVVVDKNNSLNRVIVSKIFYSYGCGYGFRAHKIKKNGDKYQYDQEIWYPENYEEETDGN